MEVCELLFAFGKRLRYLQQKKEVHLVNLFVGVDGFEPPTLCL